MDKAGGIFQNLIQSVKGVSRVVEDVNNAMIEQMVGGKEIIKSLEYINTSTSNLKNSSSEASSQIVEIRKINKNLKDITDEFVSNFSEIEIGLKESTQSIQLISESIVSLSDQIRKVSQEVEKFKV